MQQKHYADVQVVIMTANNSLVLFSSIESYIKKGEVLSQGFLRRKVIKTEFTNNFHVSFVGLYSHIPIYSCYNQSFHSTERQGAKEKGKGTKELLFRL